MQDTVAGTAGLVLLRACLKRRICELKNQRTWASILPGTPEGRVVELQRQIVGCQRLLASPSRITKQGGDFLPAEYPTVVLSEVEKGPIKSSGKLSPDIDNLTSRD